MKKENYIDNIPKINKKWEKCKKMSLIEKIRQYMTQ